MKKGAREAFDYTVIVAVIGIGLILIILVYMTVKGIISVGEFSIGAGTFLLAMATFYLAYTEMDEGRNNRRQDRDLAARERAISNYPLLSQKINLEFTGIQFSVNGIDKPSGPHYKLIIKNFGKGPAINQDRIYYRFFKGENQIHQNFVRITGAHDIIAPDGDRPLDMTILREEDWNLEMPKIYDIIWVRLPHEDIQRNECCNCTKYEYQPQISGRFGKTERHWFFFTYPEISSARCRECEWRAL